MRKMIICWLRNKAEYRSELMRRCLKRSVVILQNHLSAKNAPPSRETNPGRLGPPFSYIQKSERKKGKDSSPIATKKKKKPVNQQWEKKSRIQLRGTDWRLGILGWDWAVVGVDAG